MAGSAQSDQVFRSVIAEQTPGNQMMHLEIGQAAAALATPPVPLEHLSVKPSVRLWIEPQAGTSLAK